MTRTELEHLLRTEAEKTGERAFVVGKTAALLAQVPSPPSELALEVEIVPGSPASVTLDAMLPTGWQTRLVPIHNAHTGGATGYCVDIHDMAASMYASGSDTAHRFCADLVRFGLVDHPTLEARVNELPIDNERKQSIVDRLHYHFAAAAC